MWQGSALECTYCGEYADTKDHVIPVSWNYVKRKRYCDQGYTVPACRRCNGWLGKAPLFTISARCEHIVNKLVREVRRHGGAANLSDRYLNLAARLQHAKGALKLFQAVEAAIEQGKEIPRC
jgi:hypothetical protein